MIMLPAVYLCTLCRTLSRWSDPMAEQSGETRALGLAPWSLVFISSTGEAYALTAPHMAFHKLSLFRGSRLKR